MLSEERVKVLLTDPTLSDEKIREIRDGFRNLAEVIFDKWQQEKYEQKVK